MNCDFESEGLCKWTANGPITRKNSGEQNTFQKKPEDHTTDSLFGHTAVFVAGDRSFADLISPIIQPSYHKCLTFAFMKNDRGISVSLFETLGENKGWKEVWHPPRYYVHDQWHVIQVPVQLTKTTQFKLEINNYQNSHDAAIQIDDIQLRPYCLPELIANFQYGLTSDWHSPKSDKVRWQVGRGRRLHLDGFFVPHPVALYTDFSVISGEDDRQTARLFSDSIQKFTVLHCVKFDFMVNDFGENDLFTMDIVFENDKRTTVWAFDRKTDGESVLHSGRRVAIPAQNDFYRVEFVATSNKRRMSATVLKIDVKSAPLIGTNGECVNTKTPTQPTVAPTSGPVSKSKINPAVKALVNVMLKNVRTEVQNILNAIGDKKDVLYELVGDVEGGLDRALSSIF